MASREYACPACRQANRETASFCRECGFRLAAVDQSVITRTVADRPVSNALGGLSGQIAGSSYAAFVAGFSGTAEDAVTITSVSGGEVTAQLVASQTDGTVKDYSGVHTIADGPYPRLRYSKPTDVR